MITHMKDDGTQALEFYWFERPKTMKREQAGEPLKKCMSYIAAKRKDFDNSMLYC